MENEIISSDLMNRYVNIKQLRIEDMDSYPEYIGLDQMREILGGMGKRQAFALVLRGQINSILVGRTRLIKRDDLFAYAKSLLITDKQKKQIEDILRSHYEKLFAGYPDIVSTEILEKMLNASNNYVLRRLQNGQIKSLFIGRTHRIPKKYVIDFAISREHQKNKRRFPHLV